MPLELQEKIVTSKIKHQKSLILPKDLKKELTAQNFKLKDLQAKLAKIPQSSIIADGQI